MSNLFTERVLNMAAVTPQPEDYTGEDGLLYCGKCHTPKEAYFAELAVRIRRPGPCNRMRSAGRPPMGEGLVSWQNKFGLEMSSNPKILFCRDNT